MENFNNTEPNDIDVIEIENQKRIAKKHFVLKIVGIFTIAFLVYFVFFASQLPSKNGQVQNTPKNEDKIRFSYGEIKDNKYINKWAELTFNLENDWTQADDETYLSQQSEDDKTGLCVVNKDGEIISVSFSDIAKELGEYDEEELAEKYFEKYASEVKNGICSELETELMGLNLYKYIDVESTNEDQNSSKSVYIRRQNDFYIIIKITSGSSERNHDIFKLIEYYG